MANNHLASYLDNQKLHCSMVSYGVHGAMRIMFSTDMFLAGATWCHFVLDLLRF